MTRRLLLLSTLLAAACSGPQPEAPATVAAAPATPACGLAEQQVGTFVTVPEGAVEMGANAMYPEEKPARTVHVAAFSTQVHEVTNAQFERFVAATGYVTDAERSSASSDPAGGSALFVMPDTARGGGWMLKRGATWKTPGGPGTGIARHMNEPVVHVSLADAHAYAAWAGGRLPTEEEWEYAAASGLADPDNRFSGAMDADGKPIANFWQGIFPVSNDVADGFAGAAPVGCFPASKLGLYDMIGNVWEWTDTPYAPGSNTIKGGSYLCAENYCARYRSAARQGQEVDFSSNHIGFRIVKDAAPN
jgi:formylglycine-generating enzyme required for sulfatase activity